jgi:hypothetical protein
MRMLARAVFWSAVITAALYAWSPRAFASSRDVLDELAKRIVSAGNADSTAVLVVFDPDLLNALRMRLPQSVEVVPYPRARPSGQEALTPAQVGQMFREASTATMNCTEVWVVGSPVPNALKRAATFADMAARVSRRRVLRDSVSTSRGVVTFSRWVDLPGGLAQRIEMRRALAQADSVMAHGIPRPAPMTRPFNRSELALDADTVSFYVTRLADTSFYSIGGCSEVETVFWNASERLGQLGPGIVPVLVARIADPNPFVRERAQDALLFATQDERILARTGGDYLKFYDQPERSPSNIVETWWKKFGHFWAAADSAR